MTDAQGINGQALHGSLPRGVSSCTLCLTGRTLVARLPSGEVMKMELGDAEVHKSGPEGSQLVYRSTVMGGPTFVTDDADLNLAVRRVWSVSHARGKPRAASPGQPRLSRSHKVALGIVASVLSLLLLAVLLVGPLVPVTIRLVPRAVDRRIGEEAFPHVLRQVGTATVEHAPVLEPVQAVLDRLTAAVPNNPFFFRVAVSRSPVVNAFALPGGQIIVTTGMLARLESGEELAAVLAHEMNHVLLRHAMQMTIRASGLRFLVYALSRDHPIVSISTSVWSAVGLMSMSREKESQADLRAVRLLANANVDPKAMVPMFGRLLSAELRPAEGAGGGHLLERLRSHPETGKRIADVEAEIASVPAVTAPQAIAIDYGALVAAVQALDAEPSLPSRPAGEF
jgi:beta-barrel assembly-enhancing protease